MTKAELVQRIQTYFDDLPAAEALAEELLVDFEVLRRQAGCPYPHHFVDVCTKCGWVKHND